MGKKTFKAVKGTASQAHHLDDASPTCGRIDRLGPDLGVSRQAVKDEEQQMLQAAAGADELLWQDMMQIIHE